MSRTTPPPDAPTAQDPGEFLGGVQLLGELQPDRAVFAVDAERRITYWSAGAELLLGYTSQEVLGKPCLEAQRCHQCIVGCGLQRQGRVDQVPLVLLHRSGAPVAVTKTGRAVLDASGRFAGGVEVLTRDDGAGPVETELPADTVAFHGMVARDSKMLEVFELVRTVARSDVTVLVRGETGSGKEGIARAIHLESKRAKGPFVAINCATLSATLLESELFGHVRGAFTGALRDHPGLFVAADRGTLLLDEVAELPLELQARLLRVLQERSVTPVGGTKARTVDVRIVAATHQSLRQAVAEGRFRQDLLYRLRVVPIFVPALRERPGDIPLLLWHAIEQRNTQGQRVIRRIAPDAMRALLAYPWPGNVRELLNAVDYAFAIGRSSELRLADLPAELREVAPLLPLGTAPAIQPTVDRHSVDRHSELGSDEAEQLRRALASSGGHVGKAAALLGMSRPTFWRHRRRLGI
ncbi:MAG: sigma 54-interacting transcriptional regulator [Deltaproteobacteria bacterium]|nr:sigma 54-interacting transcriptional regulator [Deltaproteobacteria bacterium]